MFMNLSSSECAIIISILAIFISYYGVISKKPRVFFRIEPIAINGGYNFNLVIFNCGDKPAFNIKITTIANLEDYINTEDEEYSKKRDSVLSNNGKQRFIQHLIKNIQSFKKRNVKLRRVFDYLINYKDYEKVKAETLNDLQKCFNTVIPLISGSDQESIFIGTRLIKAGKDKRGFLKPGFQVDANISFYEEIRLDFFAKNILKLFIELLIFSYVSFIQFSSIFGIYFFNTFISNYLELKNKISNFVFFGVKFDIFNGKILINHSYEYKSEVADNFIYKALNRDLPMKFIEVCETINLNNAELFFNSHLYIVWEDSLTNQELRIMDFYKMEFLYHYELYISMYSIIFDNNYTYAYRNDEEITQEFKYKYVKFIHLLYHSNLVSIENKRDIELITYDYRRKGIKFNFINDIYSNIDNQINKYPVE